MTAEVCIRTAGGPRPGTKMVTAGEWPLPELLLTDGGQYVKVSEDIQPQRGQPRSARYNWQPGDATAGQLTAAITVAIRARRLDETVALLHLLAPRDPGRAKAICDLITILAPAGTA